MTRRGLTIIEVLIALAVIGIAFAILSTALVNSLQHTQRAGVRTQSTQYLNYLGRKVAGGDAGVLAAVGTPIVWDYGALGASFADLPAGSAGPHVPHFADSVWFDLWVWFVASGVSSGVGSVAVGGDAE